MRITDEVLIREMTKFLDECDRDELARIAEQMFGGECFLDLYYGEGYVFTPNENYTGVFGEDWLFAAICATGIVYCDKTVEVGGDYKELAFLSYSTLELQWYAGCPEDKKDAIQKEANVIIDKRGQQFATSVSGQYITLGE